MYGPTVNSDYTEQGSSTVCIKCIDIQWFGLRQNLVQAAVIAATVLVAMLCVNGVLSTMRILVDAL